MNNLLKSSLIYLSYLGLAAVGYQIVISLLTFFHFQLGHRVGTIEDWIFDQGWLLVIFAKFISFYVFYKIFTMDFNLEFLFKRFFKKPPPSLAVAIVFLWSMQFIIWGRPLLSDITTFNIVLDSIFGHFAFYFFDFFILFLIIRAYPLEKKKRTFLRSLIFMCLYLLSLNYFYPFSLFDHSFQALVWAASNFFFLSYVALDEKESYSLGFIWIFLYIVPTGLLYALDPIYTKVIDRLVAGVHYFPLLTLLCAFYIRRSSESEQSWLRESGPDKV